MKADRIQCGMLAVLLAILLLAAATGAGQYVPAHRAAIADGLADAAAAGCVLAAAVILAACARAVTRYRGQHADTAPGDEPVPVPGTQPRPVPVPARDGQPAFAYTLRPAQAVQDEIPDLEEAEL